MLKPISFCQDWDPLIGSYPSSSELRKLNNPPRLTQIRYKAFSGDQGLYALQLVFSDNFNTPIFETKWQQNSEDLVEGKLETIEIHPKATITAIAMKVWDRAETETGVENNNQKE